MERHLDIPRLRETYGQRIQDLLARARRRGASAAEASLGIEKGLTATVRLGRVETLEYHHDRGLTLTVYLGHAKGSANTTDLRPEALEATLEAALAIARHTGEDPYAGLPDPDHLARQIPDLDLYHPWDLDAAAAIELARRCEAAAREADPRIDNSEGATLASHEGLHLYGNSHGFLGAYAGTRHSLSCTVIASDGQGGMQRDYHFDSHRRPQALAPPEAIGRRAAERTVARLGARPLATCQAPVLFDPNCAAGLLRHFTAAIRGGRLYRRTSFLVDSLGQAVFPDWFQLLERPFLPQALASHPFDSEGVAPRERALVEDGRLQGYLLNSYAARRLGLEPTGNAGPLHNLQLRPHGPGDLDAMIAAMGRGLLVTELMGQGVNLVTGDYSRGASGFWIEDGAIAHPVEEITIAGNLKEMFAGLVAAGSDVDRRRAIQTGSLWLERMTIAGRG